MKFLSTYQELNEKKKQKTKLDLFRERTTNFKIKIYKAKDELEEINRNDNEDSSEIKDLKKEIKNIEIKVLEIDYEKENLKYKKDYLKSKLKNIKKSAD